ncbi:MAG TPA: hypothetical protein VKS24_21445 [Bradyrhizobium sp.]|nr:hypothetical protein [Bradyrhizobium sp.]
MIPSLESVVVLNESQQAEVVGEVSLYRSISRLIEHLEPIDVENNEFFAYALRGNRLDLSVENDQVQVVKASAENDYSSHIRNLLEVAAERALRKWRHRKMRGTNPATMSIEALVELIGFTWQCVIQRGDGSAQKPMARWHNTEPPYQPPSSLYPEVWHASIPH